MRKIILLVAVLSLGMSGQPPSRIINLDALQQVLNEPTDGTLVVNFWATWCAPCIKELPLFEQLAAEARPGLEVLLVSLDLDLDDDPEKVYRFIERKKLRSKVVLLDAPDPDAWINQVEKKWSGTLPATLVINRKTGKRKFVGRALGEGELAELVDAVR